ncbi:MULTISPECIES: PEP-CTERM sorting domain-containing protein [unclassified Roseofilum]|uniref:PEP-CTERM sorting domain-containing protein n=1 Tax=unclassified Roseofilum TaxID=2620099 RepID=UPI000E84EF6B|nr:MULTISPECIES: PEP-CTERM sorting domain-containing protein [unclassified Roseofilum]HBQ97505.1 hypothetical protein [Cyanobacteria bacterium UBA11691]MBP0008303.1 PEP-CTERM sorting domain-containing protein [Roseofilum sp. Belize Diploria]MBP0012992.1 PEP-CTERM sorting domain-containing protein [Roseofilum sp. SID3]MBP0023272.1 PEP-CTERM sorting domain-containing protein [Roseofilum sp. SID2]MBP0033162.1 PEP-CTERM sorting domain-containing protein [Roseofilum sp. Belize BBD 4]
MEKFNNGVFYSSDLLNNQVAVSPNDISTSWKPDECQTAVTGISSACDLGKIPEPSAVLALLGVGAFGSLFKGR